MQLVISKVYFPLTRLSHDSPLVADAHKCSVFSASSVVFHSSTCQRDVYKVYEEVMLAVLTHTQLVYYPFTPPENGELEAMYSKLYKSTPMRCTKVNKSGAPGRESRQQQTNARDSSPPWDLP